MIFEIENFKIYPNNRYIFFLIFILSLLKLLEFKNSIKKNDKKFFNLVTAKLY